MVLGIGLVLAGAVAAIAYLRIGFLGVAILGLLVVFVSQRVEIERDGPVGSPQATGLHAASRREPAGGAERAAVRAEAEATAAAARAARRIGAGLALVGAAGFALFQDPWRGRPRRSADASGRLSLDIATRLRLAFRHVHPSRRLPVGDDGQTDDAAASRRALIAAAGAPPRRPGQSDRQGSLH